MPGTSRIDLAKPALRALTGREGRTGLPTRLVRHHDARLLTLTGAGGSGLLNRPTGVVRRDRRVSRSPP